MTCDGAMGPSTGGLGGCLRHAAVALVLGRAVPLCRALPLCSAVPLCSALLICSATLPACSGFDGANDQLPLMEQGALTAANAAAMMGAGSAGSGAGGSALTAGPVNSAAADWSCLGAPPAASPGITGTGNVHYSATVRSMFNLPITNFEGRVCEAVDLSCASPLSEIHGLGSDGLLEVDLPIGFAGFIEFEADNHAPAVFYMRRPVFHDTVDLLPIPFLPTAGLMQLAGLLNVELLPDLGILSVAAIDCRGERAPGVTFENNLGGKVLYFIDGLPNVMVNATDILGFGGFVNVPPRLLEVSAEVAADARQIGTRSVVPRVGRIVGVTVRPAALPLD